MIKLIERYIAKTIISMTFLTAAVMMSVLFLMMLLGEFKNIGEGDYGLDQAILYVISRLPNDLYQFFPMLILIGSILGLSILTTSRELIVIRSAGFSVRQIIVSVLNTVLLLTLLMSFFSEWFAPRLSYQAEVRKENARSGGQAVVTAEGLWLHVENNFIHVQQVIGRQLLKGVTRYQFAEDHRLQSAYYAKTLTYQHKQWSMHDVDKTTFYPERTKSEFISVLPWDLPLNANLLNIGLVDASEMTLPKLLKYTNYLKQNELQASGYEFNLWQRLFQPLASLIMIFLAIPFVLGNSAAISLGWRIFLGIITGFVFFMLNALLGQLCIVYQVPPVLAAAIPLFLFVLIGFLLSKMMIKQ